MNVSTDAEVRRKRKLIRGILAGLNPAQREAVVKTVRCPSLVIAGAGSGKTRVLQKRVAYILANDISPRKILAVTFTNKASKEMKERIAHEVGEKKAKQITIGTFHSLCVRWLHQYYDEAGLKKNWVIYDDDDTSKLMKNLLKDMAFDASAQMVYLYKALISEKKNAMITPSAFAKTATSDQQDLSRIYTEYQARLQKSNSVDFDDLIMKFTMLLETDPVVRATFQRRYKYVMSDEYQDSNECQYRMLKAIVGKKNNIFVVGDDFQSIYGWRGADISKILNFQKDYPGTKIVKLEENYRSTKTIVQAGNELMKFNANQMDKVCFSSKKQGEKIRQYKAPDDEGEAQFISQEIYRLATMYGHSFKDIAILYRTNVQSRLLEDHFIRMGIPYNMVSGFSFYERKEIKDVMAWIQVAINPDNDLACERIAALQEGIGGTTVKAMKDKAKKHNMSLYEVVERYQARTVKGKAALVAMTDTVSRLNVIYEAGKDVSDTPVSDMISIIFKYTNYIDKLKTSAKEEDASRIDNLRELQKIAKGFEKQNPDATMQDFLDTIALQSKDEKLDNADEVQMMTLHTSKGLEYKIVFLIGMEEGLFPHKRSLIDADQLDEERRICYVGVTRAQELLYMTHAERRMDYQRNYNWQKPSRFLSEIPPKLIKHL